MDQIITAIANSMLASGTVSEAHILLGLFVITIIALRKSRQNQVPQDKYEGIVEALDNIQAKLKDLSDRNEITAGDIESLHSEILEIKNKIDAIDLKLQ